MFHLSRILKNMSPTDLLDLRNPAYMCFHYLKILQIFCNLKKPPVIHISKMNEKRKEKKKETEIPRDLFGTQRNFLIVA